MVLNLREPDEHELRARITVFGVGGAGGNAVNNMIEKRLEGVEFIAANTDAQALGNSQATRTIQLGTGVTRGLGAGSKPNVGYSAAEESSDEIANHLDGSHMCFITAGMGGGTGTGAAPVVARIAREMGILTVGVVTKPFAFEGARRMSLAEHGIDEMQNYVDTLIVIPNQNLFQVASERTTFVEAFQMADDVLYQGVQGVTDLMVRPGMINLDFADVRSVMEEMGKAMMGTGEAEGETRAIDAAEKAIANPLLDEVSLKGAKGVLINITGGYDLTLFEMDEAANRIKDEVDPNALIKFGSAIDPDMEGKMRVSVVATGIEAELQEERPPVDTQSRRRVSPTDPNMMAALRGSQRRFEPVVRADSRPEPESEEIEEEVEAEIEAEVEEQRSAPVARSTTSAPVRSTTSAPSRAPVGGAQRPAMAGQPVRSAQRPTMTAKAASQMRATAMAARQPDEQVEDQPEESFEQRVATSPAPNDIRARAEEVRRRALAARAQREAEAAPEPVVEEPALFDLDEASIEPEVARAEPEVRRASAGRAERPQRAEPQERAASSRPGLFTINRLINRVAGHHSSQAAAPGSERRLEARDEDEGDIPAFLRRQAN